MSQSLKRNWGTKEGGKQTKQMKQRVTVYLKKLKMIIKKRPISVYQQLKNKNFLT